jgi:hypothetical protein
MYALTKLKRHYLVVPFQRTRTRLQLLARGDAGPALQAAATTLVLAITGGLEYLVNELHLTWKRLRLLSRDDAGYTTPAVIITALLPVLAIAAGAILWTHVISKAIHTRHDCTGLVKDCQRRPGFPVMAVRSLPSLEATG